MKVMVCGDYRSIPLTRRCADALATLGCTVERFDSEDRVGRGQAIAMRLAKSLAKPFGRKQQLSEHFAAGIYRRRRDRFLAAVAASSPDAVIVVRGNHIDQAALAGLDPAIRKVCWFIRDHKRMAAIRAERPAYDLYYSMHRSHAGDGIAFLPAFAHEPEDYWPDAAVSKDVPLLFLGLWTPRRQQWLEALAAQAPQLAIIGPHWRSRLATNHPLRACVRADWVKGDDLRRWYQRSQVVININQWSAADLTGANLRVADVPACGTVLLSEYSDDLAGFFSLGEELLTFGDPDELRAQVTTLLADAARRQRLAAAGRASVLRLGTYRDRMARILADLQGLPGRSAPTRTVDCAAAGPGR